MDRGAPPECGSNRDLFEASELRQVVLPTEPPGRTHIYNQFVIRGPRRDELRAHLESRRIGTEVYYPLPLHKQPCFQDARQGDVEAEAIFPHAEHAAATSLALPIYGELTLAQQRVVVGAIAEFVETTEAAARRGSARV